MKRKGPTIDGRPATMGALRAHVINRDRICLGFLADPTHQCRNRYGDEHQPDDLEQLTLEHVPGVHGPEDVRRDDPAHCGTLCYFLNVGGTPVWARDFIRLRLRERYPDCTKGE